ncbi:CorA family divalent cation transporter [Serratia grimesii]|uniref:CorA family divalent cation transporter n=1 Tax=Serratia grimesii TaxID=82995 RepID=UPI002240DEFC|nr:CorA family divalent cation transporter [Serratia grimesii]
MANLSEILIAFGWGGIVVGIMMGGLMGMYAFKGPFRAPKGHENYTNLNRRMLRLAHIAFIMLPLISMLYGMNIDTLQVPYVYKYYAAICMVILSVGIPVLLIAACFYLPFKYIQVIPFSCGMFALVVMAVGKISAL